MIDDARSPAEDAVELRRQLDEANAQLDAIRRGDVDALVVVSGSDAQLVTVPGADRPYRLLVNAMAEGALTVADGHVLLGNPAASKLTGIPSEELVGRRVADLVTPASRPVLEELLDRSSPTPLPVELDLVRSDGTIVPVSALASELDLDGTPAICLLLDDLRERREAIAALRFQATLLGAAGEAILATGPDGVILYANAAAEDLYDWPPGELVGHEIAELRAPGTDDLASRITGRLERGLAWRGELQARRRDGSELPVMVTMTPVLGADRALSAAISISTDLTEHKRAHDALAESERRFRTIVSDSGDMFAMTDAEARVHAVYGPVHEALGVTADAVMGTTVFDWLRPEDQERARRLWAELLSKGSAMPPEDYWTYRPDGTIVCISVVAQNFLADPGVGAVVCTARDVTAMRHLSETRVAISAVNSALVKATSEIQLLDQVCRAVAALPAYSLAWVGFVDPDAALGVRVVSSAGGDVAYLESLEVLARTNAYEGPLARALATGSVQICHDVADLAGELAWRDLALEHGHRSVIALPLQNDEMLGVLGLYSRTVGAFTDDAVDVLQELANDLAFGLHALRTRAEREEYQRRFEHSLETSVQAVGTAVELRDPYTAGHQRRVAELATAIAAQLGLDHDHTYWIGVAASIHDIGKLAIPAEILSKPSRLSDIEYALVKGHSRAGYDIMSAVDFPYPVADMIHQHHERLDGSGYPQGLVGDDIDIGARIIAVADTVEAVQSHRPYRPGRGSDQALEIIAADRGTRLDAAVVDACVYLLVNHLFDFTP